MVTVMRMSSQEQVFHSTDIDGDSYMRDDFESTKAEIIC
ncbi:hypothetical protein ISN45_Aa02g027170 [Arabidopsis thaliana x Arabidopsis arenosa]|uniref:Uncharacterized protein n=1 Tax=Arabidopsis thaliana x Arabidopsis arenosa TaxID=1240361 RepID=A0A8T2BVL2_9BRAS|nr:hypothetical protein ISN45_Aa02g027170 [Arabidopsis thaliana x Arabidopsis arenosa]